jgi:hypothetical protein
MRLCLNLHIIILNCVYHSSNVQHTIYHEYKIGINNKSEYSHSEVLVDIQWIEDHLRDEKVHIAKVEYDATANYSLGDIFGSSVLLLHWKQDINDPITRNILSKYETMKSS